MIAGRLAKKKEYFYIVLSYSDDAGKRKEKWIKTGLKIRGNKAKADEMLLEYRTNFDVNTGKLKSEQEELKKNEPDRSEILFGDYLLEWCEDIKGTVELSTYAGYRFCIERVIAPYFNERKITLKNLNAHIIDEFYSEKLKIVSANTVIHYHANIRKALQDAYKNDLIPCNYADKAHRPKKSDYISNYYNRDELLTLFQAVKGKKIEFAVLMAGYYGLRRSEVIGLKWSNVDFKYKTITIKHTVTTCSVDGKYLQIAKDRAKTKKSIRSLPLIPPIYDFLVNMKKQEEINKEFFGSNYITEYDDYIYKEKNGELVKPDFVTTNFALQLSKNPDLPKIRFHALRHSCAALLRHEGVPMEDIQKWLGHSQITTTESIYAHFDTERHLNSAQKIFNAFSTDDT
ncbi:MAG: site-specific integrase [Clostridiales bacterium]|nr:site-specific integrase [Clostridiales bacterium]